jgi:transposase
MPVKTDRKDARGIAQLMRLGWFRSVHCKSLRAQETRALLTARKLVQSKHHDTEMSLRGILRGFGLKVGKTSQRTFASRAVAGAVFQPRVWCGIVAGRLRAGGTGGEYQ